MGENRIISSDDHIMEPVDLWTSRGDPKLMDRLPRVERMEDGSDWWFCDGYKLGSAFSATLAGVRFEEPEKLQLGGANQSYDNARPGGWIPEEHIKDMDIDGIDMGIVYPTEGLFLYSIPDGNLLNTIFATYNDWLADFCSTNPKRLKGIGMLNVDDIGVGIKELERCAKLGFPGAMISAYPPDERNYSLPDYEPLWSAAEDLDIPISLHVGTNRPGPGQEFANIETATAAFTANTDHWVRMSLSHMIYNGVFERHPKLQIGAIEQELAWVPHFLDRIDYAYTQRPLDWSPYRFKEDMLPSDYFHRQVFLSFQEDIMGIRDRHVIGVDNLVWGSDYPHPESTFPKSREILGEILADCTEEEKAKITGGNSARIYKF